MVLALCSMIWVSFLIEVTVKLCNYYLHIEEIKPMYTIEEFEKITCLQKL